ncbi:MAG TPA: S8 family serine peptidase [Anaeromyxobacteraceae bacterium]
MTGRTLALAALAAGLPAACHCGSRPPSLVAIALTPASPTIPRGLSRALVATGSWSDGSELDLSSLATWTSADPSVASVSGGVVAAHALGTTTVAAAVGSIRGTATVAVDPPLLTGLSVTPASASIPRGLTRQLAARGAYSDATAADVTALATWTSSSAGTASVTPAGLVTGVAVGLATVTAAVGGIQGTARVAVEPPAVTGVAVTPSTTSVWAGHPQQLRATARYSDSTTADVGAAATWSSATPSAVAVSATGLASEAAGAPLGASSVVSASAGGFSGSATVSVAAGPPVGPGVDGDPLLAQQWHLRNTGQTAYADLAGVAGNDLHLAATYAIGLTGAGVKVGVVDSGLEIAHQDLAANVVAGSWDFVTDADPDPTSASAAGDHGTSVAGLVAAVRGNAAGGMGVAPAASLNGYSVIASSQLTSYFVRALGGSASNPRSSDVFVFNQSYGTGNTSDFPVDPVVEAQYLAGVTSLRGGRGALYVKSAGNGFYGFGGASCARAVALGTSCQNASMDPSNTLPYNVVVGALNASGVRSSYSTAGSALWVSAPAGEFGLNSAVRPGLGATAYMPAMVTTDQTGCSAGYAQTGASTSTFNQGLVAGNATCSYTNTFNGTSSAAPSTSGAIALLLQANPSLGWRDVKHLLAATATRVDPSRPAIALALAGGTYVAEPAWTQNAAGHWFHAWYGFGAVNVDAAVAMATAGYELLPAFRDTGWIASGPLSLPIPDAGAAGATHALPVPAGGPVVEAVQVAVSAAHPYTGDLGIELASPAGTRSVLLNVRNGFDGASLSGMVLLSNAFYGEGSAGTWTLRVVDGDGAHGAGSLTGWQIRVFGH